MIPTLRPSRLRSAPARLAALLLLAPLALSAQQKATMEQYLNPASPLELTAAHKADRIAWMAYDRGMRNVYTAAAPDFKPVRLTKFLEDDGTDLTNVELSADGSIAVFVRGSAPNRNGWVANPDHNPSGAERAIWAVRTNGSGPAWRVAEGSNPELSPDGKYVLFAHDGQIYRGRVTGEGPKTAVDTGGVPFIKMWGNNSNPRWSPDGSKIAFTSARENHALVLVYDMKTRKITYIAPSVDCDASPTWSPDSKRLAFIRRPGVPFGQQAQQGGGGIGNPQAPGFSPAAQQGRGGPAVGGATGCGGGGFGFGGGGGRGQAQGTVATPPARSPGLYSATFKGGYTLSLMVADVATGEAKEFWHTSPTERVFTGINNIRWAGDNVVFAMQMPNDEWDRWFSIRIEDAVDMPIPLIRTDGMIEDATSVTFSADGKTMYYCTNASDIERRHIWAVPTAGGEPKRISTGEGIETYPAAMGSGKQLAVIYFNAAQPASIGIVPTAGGDPKIVFPTLPKDFPQAAHVMPQTIITKAADGLEIHNTLFVPKDLKPGEKRPAMIFVHGGPQRQMMPGYHYFQFYHWAYAFNQYLADQGYIVLSINYRSGVGYGRSFRNAPNTAARGNAEYQDVLAGAHYLQVHANVDASRIGIWGLSYGGLLTSQALARNSDIFVAGVDLAGVHLYGPSLDSTNVSYTSSSISQIDKWKSPVFLVHGDDDRNVSFSQTVGLVQLLRARGIYHELVVIPDDLHESMLHKNWVYTFGRMSDFLKRFVWNKEAPPK
jgi:dipeptidyl-peptidase-4